MERLTNDELQSLTVSRLEHRHRYLCAAALAKGEILDIACGVGYGADILLGNPTVTGYVGMDVEEEAIAEAQVTARPGRRFLVGSAYAIEATDAAFDTVVSLETLEHLNDPACALGEFRRVLRPDGLLIGSVPTAEFERFCTLQYGPNPYHLQAFEADALGALLLEAFPHVRIFVARIALAAGLYDADGRDGPRHREVVDGGSGDGGTYGSYVFVASAHPLPENVADRLGILSVGGSYYEAERLQMNRLLAGHLRNARIAGIIQKKDDLVRERDERIQQKNNLIREKDERIQQKDDLVRERDALIKQKDDLIRERDERIQQKDDLVREKDERIQQKDNLVRERDELMQQMNDALAHARALAAAKDARLRVTEERLQEVATRLQLSEEAAEAGRSQAAAAYADLARLQASRGWRLVCRVRNLTRLRFST
jgi:SAM-dependent methyltransferase